MSMSRITAPREAFVAHHLEHRLLDLGPLLSAAVGGLRAPGKAAEGGEGRGGRGGGDQRRSEGSRIKDESNLSYHIRCMLAR